MGQFGRLTSIADLPPQAELEALIARATSLIDSGSKASRPINRPKPELAVPDDLAQALTANSSAQTTFDAFPPSCRREYLEWIVEAKRPQTRAKRLAQAVEWMAEGKRRNWKYEKC